MIPNRRGKSTVFQTILSCIIFFGTIGMVILLVNLKKKPAEEPDTRKDLLVDYVEVASYSDDIKINVTGVALPFREINISAEVTGSITVKTDRCQAGRYVESGDHLLSIDSRKYALALKRANSEVDEAKARAKKVDSELKAAREIHQLMLDDLQFQSTENQKREQLFKQNAISETELTQSRRSLIAARNAEKTQGSRVDTLEADLLAQKSLVSLKEVMREEAEVDFKKAVIHAPSRGVIISDDVQKDDFVQVGKSLLVFEDTSAIEVRCDLRSDQLQSVLDSAGEATDGGDPFSLPPLEARIRYEGNGHVFEWAGVLDRYDGLGLNEKTRTAPCRILVRNTKSLSGNRTLVRGMYVSVQLNLGKQEDLLALPAEAIKAGNVVWLVEQDKLQERVVRVVNRMSDSEGREMAIIQAGTAGLSRGLKAIVSPIPQPTIGMRLRSRNVTDPADSGKATGSGEPQKDEPDASSSSESGGNTVRSATTTRRKIGRQG